MAGRVPGQCATDCEGEPNVEAIPVDYTLERRKQGSMKSEGGGEGKESIVRRVSCLLAVNKHSYTHSK